MIKKRKIAIFTGNRAEYGLQFPIINAIKENNNFDYALLVSGAHLDKDFGLTLKEIKNDGFKIYDEVKLDMPGDDLYATVNAIGSGILNLSKILNKLKPDIMLVYADRFESLSAIITSTQMSIPTVHIEGGDVTEGGALDDSVRHAMTKLAHLHFTTNEDAANRILKLGEENWRVFNVGFPIIDLIKAGNFTVQEELIQKFNIDIEKPLIIFTQHSVSTEFDEVSEQIIPSLEALNMLSKEGIHSIITYPNNDAGGKKIIQIMERFKFNNENIKIYPSVGRHNYHGLLNLCGKVLRGVCVGNSSSGIKETPAFGCPSVIIGSRQRKRLRAGNVLETGYDRDEIITKCKKAIYDEKFRLKCRNIVNPYGEGNTGAKVCKILSEISLNKKLIQKKITF